MPPIPPKPNSESDATAEETHRAHTYQDDLAKAMNATDAAVVQEMLETAREKELLANEEEKNKKQRKLYRFLSVFFVILSIGAIVYGYYQYKKLTVPVQKTISVGVFPTTAAQIASETTIDTVVKTFTNDTTLPENKPLLITLVTDASTLSPLTPEAFFTFLGSVPTEPFVRVIDTIRLGVMNTGTSVSPFVILSVNNPEIASKEFTIAEQKLLDHFYKALDISKEEIPEEEGNSFTSQYLYNIPVRVFSIEDQYRGGKRTVLLYGYVTDNIVVVTKDSRVLKAVYDTIIKQ